MSTLLAPPGSFDAERETVARLAEERSRSNGVHYRRAGMRWANTTDLLRFFRRLAQRPELIQKGNYFGVNVHPHIFGLFDHMRLYNREGRPFAAISHPYKRLDRENMKALVDWATEVGLGVRVDADSEYYPGVTLRVVLYREGENFPSTDMA